MRDYRRRCVKCGEIFDYREACENRVVCPDCCDADDFDADELGLDPEEEYDA